MRGLFWAAIGAGLMYLFDPQHGNRRQALLRDKINRYVNRTGDMIEGKAEDLSNRAYGTMHEMKSSVGMNPDRTETTRTDATTSAESMRRAA
jgi:hypothetical protein